MTTLIITAVLSSIATSFAIVYYPKVVLRYRQRKARINKHNMMGYRLEVLETQMHSLDKMIKEEIELQLKNILND